MPSPSSETVIPVQSSAKSRSRRGRSSFTPLSWQGDARRHRRSRRGREIDRRARHCARARLDVPRLGGDVPRRRAGRRPRPGEPAHRLRRRPRAARRRGRHRGDPHAGGLRARLAARRRPATSAPRSSSSSARCCRPATGSPRAATSAPSSRPAPTSRSCSPPASRSAPSGRGQPADEVAAARRARRARATHSPMVAADDAVELDTTGLTIDEVVARIVALVRG